MEFHFLIRNGIVGFIYLLSLLGTVGLLSSTLADQTARFGKDMAPLITFGLAPLIGITIQSIYLILCYRFANKHKPGEHHPEWGLFNDMARCIIEDHVKSAMPAVQHAGTAPSTSIDLRRKALRELHDRNKTHPDPIFVALYHTKAPVHLIEWARRRRTYSYLGITGVIAAGLGALSGLLLVAYLDGSAIWKSASDSQAAVRVGDIVSFFLIAVTALLLLINIYDLSRRMKQDADQMELVWALMETDQHARKALFKDADSNSAIPPTRRRLWTMKRK